MSQTHPTLPSDLNIVDREYPIPFERRVEFDLTQFSNGKMFNHLRLRHDLTNKTTVDGKMSLGSHYRLWHWYNDEVLMITTRNPITGERMYPNRELTSSEPGNASYITLMGASDPVVDLYRDIVSTAVYIKGGDVSENRVTTDGEYIRCKPRYSDRLQQLREQELNTTSR